jgi:hypothetical protein
MTLQATSNCSIVTHYDESLRGAWYVNIFMPNELRF